MQLPYAVSPPTWSDNGLPSLNTRPFLAIHRRKYGKIPRLFPVNTYAEQLLPPCPPFNKTDNESTWKEPRRFQKGTTRMHPDEPSSYLPPSPGLSDVEPVQSRKKRGRISGAEYFNNLFPDMMENAELALNQARYMQRQSWKKLMGGSCAPPTVARDDLLDRWINENIVYDAENVSPQVESEGDPTAFDWPGTGNPLSVLKIGDEKALVCSPSGLLDSVSVYDVRATSEHGGSRVHRLFRRGRLSFTNNAVVDDMSPITDIVTADWEAGSSEPCTVIAVTNRFLSFGNICTDSGKPTIQWQDQLPVPPTYSCALNPLYPAEFVALCSDGLFSGTVEEYRRRHDSSVNREDCFHDIQVLVKESAYNRVYYGAHPRSVLLSNRKEIVQFDLRRKMNFDSREVLLDVKRDWNVPSHDPGIGVFQPLRSRGHEMVVATMTCINYFDLRMPRNPVLDWTLSLPFPVDQVCLTNLDTLEPRSDVIALASRRQCYLEVFHAVHGQGQSSTGFRPCPPNGEGKGIGTWKPPSVARRPTLWSDMPLSHLQQINGTARISGMALLPLNDDKQVSLLQWSRRDGLIGQLLDVKAQEDGEARFEGLESVRGRCIDSSTNMRNFQRRLMEFGEFKDADWMRRPISRGRPGPALHFNTKRLWMEDGRELRARILQDAEDDVDKSGCFRVPRPFVGDIRKVQEIRRNVAAGRVEGGAVALVEENAGDVGETRADVKKLNKSSSGEDSSAGSSVDGSSSTASDSGSEELRGSDEIGDGVANGRTNSFEQQQRAAVFSIRGKAISRSISANGVAGRLGDSQGAESSSESDEESSEGTSDESDSDSDSNSDAELSDEGNAAEDKMGNGTAHRRKRARHNKIGQPAMLGTQCSANVEEDETLSSSSSGSSPGSSDDEAEGGNEVNGLIEWIGPGKTLDEIGRVVRSGMAHSATPLGAGGLRESVEGAPGVRWYDVEWHAGCKADHSQFASAVTTDAELPDWVARRVYYTEEVRAGEAMQNVGIDERSGYGRLLEKMKGVFFEGGEGGGEGASEGSGEGR